MLRGLAVEFEMHVRMLPGRPDFVIASSSLCIFVDGDFWHGYRFPHWRLKLSEKWEQKIAQNIRRDTKNRRLLKSKGWQVLRIWEHQLKKSPARCRARIKKRLASGLLSYEKPGNIKHFVSSDGKIR